MHQIVKLDVMSNEKRELISCLRQSDISQKEFGQLYSIKLSPGAVVGNHFHKGKEEWLVLISGKIKLYLEDVNTKERQEIMLDSENPQAIKIIPNIAHAVENVSGGQAILLEYSSKPFNPADEDKMFYKTSPI